MAKGKKYAAFAEKLDAEKTYSFDEAIALLKEGASAKFDETVELHVNCNLDVRHADQVVRKTVVLPAGTGKDVRVCAFVQEASQEKACKDAGADFVGGEELVEKVIKEGWTDFDVAIATPDMMKVLAKAGKILGSRGLMPNPKAGTVSPTPEKAVAEAKAGKVEFKTDSTGIIHMIVGKSSFGADALLENLTTARDAILAAKPTGCKGVYIKNAYVTLTMSPSIRVAFNA